MKTYENLGEVVNHYVECEQNNHWEYFDFKSACFWLWTTIHFVLTDYAQCSEEDFLMTNLRAKFPGLSKEDIYDCLENVDEVLVVEEKKIKIT